ncbi:hypothetical protein BCR39DRAFT_574548 [Naematelia encephala]|uniref:Uncharacterized protein n=1 Tax=Naematelia encephala TaxID=71784 RepID=A0A1Y2B4L9_9TREE|nr:hypothetical protein BCR39DRAFT_574548 [Naematelia encephala]
MPSSATKSAATSASTRTATIGTHTVATGARTRTVATGPSTAMVATGASALTVATDTSGRDVATGTCTRTVVLGREGCREFRVASYLKERKIQADKVMSAKAGRRSVPYLMLVSPDTCARYHTTIQYTELGPKFDEFPDELFDEVTSYITVIERQWSNGLPMLSRYRFTGDGFHPNAVQSSAS